MLGMRHQPDHPAVGRRDARDVPHRAVGVVAVAEHYAALALELVEHLLVGDVAALTRLQRHHQIGAFLVARRPRRRIGRNLEPQIAADEVQAGVARQRPRQQARLAEHLKTVANTQHWQALLGTADHLAHHRREFRYRAATQIVTVRKAAGHHHRVDTLQVGVGVPQADGLGAGQPNRPRRVDVVECAGKCDDAHTHRHDGSLLTVQSSMTVFANSDSAISATVLSSMLSSTSSSNRLPCRTSETPSKPRRPSAPTIACPCGSRISVLGITCTTTLATAITLPAATRLPPHRHDPRYALHSGAARASKTCASATAGQSTCSGTSDHMASSTIVLLSGCTSR